MALARNHCEHDSIKRQRRRRHETAEPELGDPRIAQQITLAFGIPIERDVVRRILAARYEPTPNFAGPSWLTALGHAKDSLWSVDLSVRIGRPRMTSTNSSRNVTVGTTNRSAAISWLA